MLEKINLVLESAKIEYENNQSVLTISLEEFQKSFLIAYCTKKLYEFGCNEIRMDQYFNEFWNLQNKPLIELKNYVIKCLESNQVNKTL